MTAQLACYVLRMALWQRKRPRNVIVHTDHGGQYCSADYQESFFHSLKVERLHGEHFISREIIRATVFNYIECEYNRWQQHSWCGSLSPEQFENQNIA